MVDVSKVSPFRRKLRPDFSVRWRGALIISIPVVCLFASIFAIAALRSKSLAAQQQKEQSRVTILETNRLLRALLNAETGVRGYALTRRPEFMEPYVEAKTHLPESLESLNSKVEANPARRQQFQKIPRLAQQQMRLLEQIIKLSDTSATTTGTPALTERLLVGKSNMDALRREIAEFSEQEERSARDREIEVERLQGWTGIGRGGGLGGGSGGCV